MKDITIIAESSIYNGKGYMDLSAEVIGNDFTISTEDHNGYEWQAKCSIEELVLCVIDSIGPEKIYEILNNHNKKGGNL